MCRSTDSVSIFFSFYAFKFCITFPKSFRYHLLFSLTGGGKYNFLGTKRWLEENMDHAGKSIIANTYSLHTIYSPIETLKGIVHFEIHF